MDEAMLRQADDERDEAGPVQAEPVAAEPVEAEPVADAPAGGGRPWARNLAQIGVVVLFLAVGGGVMWLLVAQKTAPAQAEGLAGPPPVEAVAVEVGDVPVEVAGYGAVRARNRVRLVPQVGGRVVSIHPNLVEGGAVAGGEVVLTIDPADYELAVRQAEAEVARIDASLRRLGSRRAAAGAGVAQARTRLETERAEAEVARSQYEQLNPGQDVPPLVAREPQVAEAEAAVAAAAADAEDVGLAREELLAQQQSAEVALERARLDLARTELRLPEGGAYRVVSKGADVGQYVAPGAAVAELYEAGGAEVPVALSARQLALLDVPGAAATLTDEATGRSWPARAARTDGEIDPQSRLADVVAVPTGDDAGGLVPGLFVRATFAGRTLENVAAIPRLALRRDGRRSGGLGEIGGELVYVVRDGRLVFAPVELVHRAGEVAYVRGLAEGDRVVTTDLNVVTDGMAVGEEG